MNIIGFIIQSYILVVFAYIILSWLVSFNIVPSRHPFVTRLGEVLHSLTNPVLAPIRQVLPQVNGIDFSPLLLLIGLNILLNAFGH